MARQCPRLPSIVGLSSQSTITISRFTNSIFLPTLTFIPLLPFFPFLFRNIDITHSHPAALMVLSRSGTTNPGSDSSNTPDTQHLSHHFRSIVMVRNLLLGCLIIGMKVPMALRRFLIPLASLLRQRFGYERQRMTGRLVGVFASFVLFEKGY